MPVFVLTHHARTPLEMAGGTTFHFVTGGTHELHIAISPVLLGSGEPLFKGLDLRTLGYECVRTVASEKATHVELRRQENVDPASLR